MGVLTKRLRLAKQLIIEHPEWDDWEIVGYGATIFHVLIFPANVRLARMQLRRELRFARIEEGHAGENALCDECGQLPPFRKEPPGVPAYEAFTSLAGLGIS